MNTDNTFTKTLTPVNGLVVMNPATSRALSEEGEVVRGNPEYWMRRLRDGEVTESSTDVDAAPSTTSRGTET